LLESQHIAKNIKSQYDGQRESWGWIIFGKDEENYLTQIIFGFTMELMACNEYIWIIMRQKQRKILLAL